MDPDAIKVRALSLDDLPDVEACDGGFTVDSRLTVSLVGGVIRYEIEEVQAYTKRYPPEQVDLSRYIGSPERSVLIAEITGDFVGYIRLARNWNQYAIIEDFAVENRLRRRGVGRTLVRRAAEWAREHSLTGRMAETQDNNVAACKFYEACGFVLLGFDRGTYRGLNPDTQEIALFWYLAFPGEDWIRPNAD